VRAAQLLDIAGGIAFYGTRLPQYMDSPLKPPMLGHYGTDDSRIPPEMLKLVTDYLPEFEEHMYDAGHAFANDTRPESYDQTSADLAHGRTKAFLKTHVG
jgi:carboxymethylenebutenolidase